MAPLKDFERDRARQWDETSSAAAGPDEPLHFTNSTRNPASASQDARVPPHMRHLQNPVNQHIGTSNPINYGAISQPAADGSGHSSSSSTERPSPSKTHGQSIQGAQRGNNPRNSGKGYQQAAQGGAFTVSRETGRFKRNFTDSEVKPNTGWATPTPLLKDRVRLADEAAKAKEVESSKYLKAPDENTYFPATGYYIWARPDTHPAELLGGTTLSKLNTIRTAHHVYIDWDSQKECLRVSSEQSESHVATALKGVRQAVKNAEAEDASSAPLYIIVPPSAEIMTKIVQPASFETDHNGHKTRLIGFKLGGEPLSIKEKLEWKSNYRKLLENNQSDFEKHLRGITEKLANFMPWMRMRVHFGHVCLKSGQFMAKFADSEFDIDAFVKMMKSNRMNGGTLDRRLDGSFAKIILQKINASPNDFQPGDARFISLEYVEPENTLIIFLKPDNGEGLRLEGKIDRVEGSTMLCKTGTGTGQFQPGTISLFQANTRNKRVDITTIDIESGFDWTLEIIDDGIKPELTSSMAALINNSITGNTTFKKDSFGLPYPGVSPKYTHGSSVEEVVIRSVYSYKFGKSGYHVEIAVYRTWAKGRMTVEPKIESSMSMYHKEWDYTMDAAYDTTKPRDWDPQLDCFFAQSGQEGGIPLFLEDVKALQRLLIGAGCQ